MFAVDEQRFLECLDADFTRLRDVVEGALDAPVPTCPGWTGTDLARHVAEVYLHKTETMRQGKWPAPWPPELPDTLTALDDAYRALVGEFTARDMSDPSLTWYGPDQTVGFWLRRMAHETVIHRLDAELAAGVDHDPIPADLAVDGIDELLVCFLAYASEEDPEEIGEYLVDCDGRTIQVATEGASWQVQLGPGTTITVEQGESDAEAAVLGEPGAVLRWVWRRADDDEVRLDGNRWAIGKLRALLGAATQ